MKRIPTWFGQVKCVFTLAILLLTAGSATAQNEVTLPAPTGPHKIGRTSFHWKDSAHDELETSAPGDKREMVVHLFYPTDAKATGAPAVYVPDADVMRGLWNDAQLARITAMRTHSFENAPLPRGKARYPVVLFSPGGGLKALTYHALLEDLASHGSIVVALDPPYNPRAKGFEAEPLTNRIGAVQKFSGKGFVDNRCLRGVCAITRGEFTSGQQGDLQRAEIIRTDPADVCWRRLPRVCAIQP